MSVYRTIGPLVKLILLISTFTDTHIILSLQEQEPDRHDSSSSDSGITIMRPSELSPPESPSVSGAVFVETDIT